MNNLFQEMLSETGLDGMVDQELRKECLKLVNNNDCSGYCGSKKHIKEAEELFNYIKSGKIPE